MRLNLSSLIWIWISTLTYDDILKFLSQIMTAGYTAKTFLRKGPYWILRFSTTNVWYIPTDCTLDYVKEKQAEIRRPS